MKKILSLALALAMMLSVAVPVRRPIAAATIPAASEQKY